MKFTIYSMFIKTSVDVFLLELQDEFTVLLLLLLLYPLQFTVCIDFLLNFVHGQCMNCNQNQNSRVIIIVCILIYILFSFN